MFHLSLCFIVLLFLLLSVFYHGYLTDAMLSRGSIWPAASFPPAIPRQIDACRVVTSATSVLKYVRCNVRTSYARVAPALMQRLADFHLTHPHVQQDGQIRFAEIPDTSCTHIFINHDVSFIRSQEYFESAYRRFG
jgi:hypothetical protein